MGNGVNSDDPESATTHEERAIGSSVAQSGGLNTNMAISTYSSRPESVLSLFLYQFSLSTGNQ